jgi:hypothetical protein
VDHLDVLQLSDVRLYDTWTKAPLGTLLQMRVVDQIIVGVRTTYKVANGKLDALLVVGGVNAGELITDAYISGPALDVGANLEIIAIDPAPFETAPVQKLPPGSLLRYPDVDDIYFVWIKLYQGIGSGGVCIASSSSKCAVGTCYPHLDRSKLIGVAAKIDVRPRDFGERLAKFLSMPC